MDFLAKDGMMLVVIVSLAVEERVEALTGCVVVVPSSDRCFFLEKFSTWV